MRDPRILTADPRAGYLAHAAEIDAAVRRVLAGGTYILGPEVAAFEQEFAAYLGGGTAVGVANGTDAIELALRALGVGPGDRVATVANTVSATAAAIQQIGAIPEFVEIDRATMVMSAESLSETLARSAGAIRAVVPVHLYGNPAEMQTITNLARAHGAFVVEDCAQAHGAALGGRKVGAWGDAAAFSFYPTKNLGALGDGGAVFSRDPAIAANVRALRQYGWQRRYVSEMPGRNSRLDEVQAAILRVRLPHLDRENALRSTLAARYLARLGHLEKSDAGASGVVELPVVTPGASAVWHQFAIRSPAREALRIHLEAAGILAAVLYPVPLHRQPAYAQPGLSLPTTERACAEVLCLPVHPGLSVADVDSVCDALLRWAHP